MTGLTFAEIVDDFGCWLRGESRECVWRLLEFATLARRESNVHCRVLGLDKTTYTDVFDLEVGLGLANPDLKEALLILSHIHDSLLQ